VCPADLFPIAQCGLLDGGGGETFRYRSAAAPPQQAKARQSDAEQGQGGGLGDHGAGGRVRELKSGEVALVAQWRGPDSRDVSAGVGGDEGQRVESVNH